MTQIDYSHDFIAFFRDFMAVESPTIQAGTAKPTIPAFLAKYLEIAFPQPSGAPITRNIADFRSKKQGKSTLAAAVALYIASRRSYSEVVIAASDQDQSRDRVLKSAKYAIEHGPLSSHAKIFRDVIEFDTGSIIQAIPADWQGQAGGNYDAVIVDEVHAWIFENQRRLFDELIIPPTKPDGVRWLSSYAGFEGESLLLKDWWEKGLKGERLDDELPIFLNREASLLAFIDTGPESWRMPWMTPEYIKQVREAERPNTFRRLWLNEWVSAEGEFIPIDAWQACYSPDVKPIEKGAKERLVIGADASTTRDYTALVGCVYNQDTETVDVRLVKVWKPKVSLLRRGKPTIDLTETIGAEIIRLKSEGLLDCVYYDPYQLHSIAVDLEKAGVRMIELPQTSGRIAADQSLYDAIVARTIRHFNDHNLNDAIRNCIAIETARGFRIAKEKTSQKIDAAVALSMAHYGALQVQKAGGGSVRLIPNPFDFSDEPIEDIRNKIVVNVGKHRALWVYPNKHAPGVTMENCRMRAKGCQACIEQQERDGVFRQQDEEMENHSPNNFDYSEDEQNRYFQSQNDLEEMRKQSTINIFRKGL